MRKSTLQSSHKPSVEEALRHLFSDHLSVTRDAYVISPAGKNASEIQQTLAAKLPVELPFTIDENALVLPKKSTDALQALPSVLANIRRVEVGMPGGKAAFATFFERDAAAIKEAKPGNKPHYVIDLSSVEAQETMFIRLSAALKPHGIRISKLTKSAWQIMQDPAHNSSRYAIGVDKDALENSNAAIYALETARQHSAAFTAQQKAEHLSAITGVEWKLIPKQHSGNREVTWIVGAVNKGGSSYFAVRKLCNESSEANFEVKEVDGQKMLRVIAEHLTPTHILQMRNASSQLQEAFGAPSAKKGHGIL